MTIADIEKLRNSFLQKYGVNLGRSGALLLAIILNQAKSNEKLILQATKKIKESVISKPIQFKNKQEAFWFGLGISVIPCSIIAIFISILTYCYLKSI